MSQDYYSLTKTKQRGSWTIALIVLLVLAVVALGWLFVEYFRLGLHAYYADAQTEVFDELRQEAMAGDLQKAVECLENVACHHLPGTKQVEGSSLYDIVERARRSAVREIIANLRQRTGKDFGDDPDTWIKEYRKAK
jgi:hypothetical protein